MSVPMPVLKETLGFWVKSISNIHITGGKKNIFLFATPRGGSTWLMEIIASQPGVKYYDEPVNIRRHNVQKAGVFNSWEEIMPDQHREQDIVQYLQNIEDGKFPFMNPPPFRKNHRLITDRIVFKIHELEHMINDIRDGCDAYILYLLRHPIPTTLSRAVFPRLEYFLNSKYYLDRCLTGGQLKEINEICNKGDHFQRGIVSWCFENIIPLQTSDTKDWLFMSYEELLLNSEKSCYTMAETLELDRPDKMLEALNVPSANIAMSKKDTLKILEDSDEKRRKSSLVTKWKTKVSEQQEKEAFNILDLFGIDAYEYGSFIANSRYLHHADTRSRLLA